MSVWLGTIRWLQQHQCSKLPQQSHCWLQPWPQQQKLHSLQQGACLAMRCRPNIISRCHQCRCYQLPLRGVQASVQRQLLLFQQLYTTDSVNRYHCWQPCSQATLLLPFNLLVVYHLVVYCCQDVSLLHLCQRAADTIAPSERAPEMLEAYHKQDSVLQWDPMPK